jgi:quercetin dioxygenase-like cupin family protein
MNALRLNADTQAQTKTQEWGSLRFFAGTALSGTAGISAARVIIRHGVSNPRHSHPSCDEVLYLLQGHLTHYVGDAAYPMGPGDSIAIPAGVPHYAINTGAEDADMIVMYSAGERDFRLEPLPAARCGAPAAGPDTTHPAPQALGSPFAVHPCPLVCPSQG